MKTTILLTFALIFIFTNSIQAQKITSAYTGLNDKKCKTIKSDPSGAGSFQGRCPGIGGFKLDVLEGDIRQTINVIAPNRKTYELNFWYFFSGFSSVGEKAEWRLKGKTPIGLIVRFNVANAEDSTKNTSYLMIAKITKNEVCVTDVVNPGKSQNDEARKLADSATARPCKSTE